MKRTTVHCYDPSVCDGDHPEGTITAASRIKRQDPRRTHYCVACGTGVLTEGHPPVITVAIDGVMLFKHSSGRRF
jgi:hypothetical protein